MVRIAGEGNGDGVTGAPVDLFHMMEVLGARSEEGNPACKEKNVLSGERKDACCLPSGQYLGYCYPMPTLGHLQISRFECYPKAWYLVPKEQDHAT